MLVQSKLVRKGGTKIDINGQEFHFVPNEAGHEVCEITDEAVLHRLINEIPLGYGLYGADADKIVAKPAASAQFAHPLNKTGKKQKDPDTLIVKNADGDEVDLMQMDRDALAAFAQTELEIDVHAKWKVETLRDKIVEGVRAAASADE